MRGAEYARAAVSRPRSGGLLQVLEKGDDEGSLGEQHACHPREVADRQPRKREFEISFRGKLGRVEFLEDLTDVMGIQARHAQTAMQTYALQAQELGRLMLEASQSMSKG
jgi:hypothetical protein